MNSNQLLKYFQEKRIEQFRVAQDITAGINSGKTVICCMAPVKSGKKEIAQALSVLWNSLNRKIFFITSLSRKDNKEQHDQNRKKFDIDTYVLSSTKNKLKVIDELSNYNGTNSIVIFDELDYGSGHDNLFTDVMNFCLKSKIPYVGFSATPEELLLPKKADWYSFFAPSLNYKGPKWFIDNNLCFESEPFVNSVEENTADNFIIGSLSNQALNLLGRLNNSTSKKIGVVRITGEDSGPREKLIIKIVKENFSNIQCQVVNSSTPFKWNNNDQDDSCLAIKNIHDFIEIKKSTLIIINQTSTRSTEWDFQENLLFFHDHPSKTTRANTIIQSIYRPCHYHDTGHKVELYSHMDTLKLCANVEKIIQDSSINIDASEENKNNLISSIVDIWNKSSRSPSTRLSLNTGPNNDYNFVHICNISDALQKELIEENGSNYEKNVRFTKWINVLRQNGHDFWDILYNQINEQSLVGLLVKPKIILPFFQFDPQSNITSPPTKVNDIIKSKMSDLEKLNVLTTKNKQHYSIGINHMAKTQKSSGRADNLFDSAINENGGSGGAIITINIYNGTNINKYPGHAESEKVLKTKFPGIFASILVPKLKNSTFNYSQGKSQSIYNSI